MKEETKMSYHGLGAQEEWDANSHRLLCLTAGGTPMPDGSCIRNGSNIYPWADPNEGVTESAPIRPWVVGTDVAKPASETYTPSKPSAPKPPVYTPPVYAPPRPAPLVAPTETPSPKPVSQSFFRVDNIAMWAVGFGLVVAGAFAFKSFGKKSYKSNRPRLTRQARASVHAMRRLERRDSMLAPRGTTSAS